MKVTGPQLGVQRHIGSGDTARASSNRLSQPTSRTAVPKETPQHTQPAQDVSAEIPTLRLYGPTSVHSLVPASIGTTLDVSG